MESIISGIRFGARGLLRNPAFSIAAIVTLGLGLGVNAIVYSVTRSAFLKPLPFPDESSLVVVSALGTDQDGKLTDVGGTQIDVIRYASDNRTMSSMGASQQGPVSVMRDGTPETVQGGHVTASLWDVFATKPVAGRTFTRDEDQPQSSVVVISERYQRLAFGGPP